MRCQSLSVIATTFRHSSSSSPPPALATGSFGARFPMRTTAFHLPLLRARLTLRLHDDACGAVRERARATNPLHGAGIDPEPLGDLAHPAEVRPAEVRLVEVRPTEVSPGKVRLAE